MTQEEKDVQFIGDVFNKDYSNTTFTSRLYDMFSKKIELVEEYIKPERQFWYYEPSFGYRKLTVTYIRSGVMFFVFDDEPDVERAWFISSFNCMMLYAAKIYPYEIGRILSRYYVNADVDFPNICKQCKWDECEGNVDVTVVWDKFETT